MTTLAESFAEAIGSVRFTQLIDQEGARAIENGDVRLIGRLAEIGYTTLSSRDYEQLGSSIASRWGGPKFKDFEGLKNYLQVIMRVMTNFDVTKITPFFYESKYLFELIDFFKAEYGG